MVMQRQRYGSLGAALPPMSSLVQPQTARPAANPNVPVIKGPARLNPDGSAAPSLGAAQQGGTLTAPSNNLTGLAAQLAGGQGQAEALNADPFTLNQALATSLGIDPYAGLVDLVSGLATPEQLDTLVSLLAATQNAGAYPGAELNLRGGLSESMLSGTGAQYPTIAQVLGPAARASQQGNPADNPLYSILTGGDPAQQSGQLIAAVMDLAGASGLNDLQARGLAGRLAALSREYKAQQYAPGAGASGQPFIQWLQRNAPNVSQMIFGG